MGLIRPALPDLDLERWSNRPQLDRVAAMCEWWAVQGFGAPAVAYGFYVLKVALYVWLWTVFVAQAPGIAGFADVDQWWSQPIAFQKAIVWTMLFEVVGLGCGSGPLTGRYVPPVVASTHFLRPGTIRLPAFPRRVPGTAGTRRGVVDVVLYAAIIGFALRALLTPGQLLQATHVVPLVVLLPLAGLRDKTVFLSARAEHYWTMLVVFLVAGGDLAVLLGGAMVVQLAIWWGAATSKLNHHFPSVVTIMVSNSPIVPARWMRRAMYRDHPGDLRASWVARWLAHGGTVVEYTFPAVLAISDGGWPTTVALAAMFTFHLFITASIPMGVPIEWNILFVYSMFVLFGANAAASPLDVAGAPLLVALLLVGLAVGPVLGNLRPDLVSFLPSMRYYAGNWAASLWLFGDGASHRFEERMTTTARTVAGQLEQMRYDPTTVAVVLGRLRAFRSMHLHGRALNALLPVAVDDLESYDVQEGEGIAGTALGWNFGDGHLHQEQLLAAVQERCEFAPGQLRGVFLESQPFHRPWMHWRIVDAAQGLVAEGRVRTADLLDHQPVPAPGAIDLGVLAGTPASPDPG